MADVGKTSGPAQEHVMRLQGGALHWNVAVGLCLSSGKLRVSYWKYVELVYLSKKRGDFPVRKVLVCQREFTPWNGEDMSTRNYSERVNQTDWAVTWGQHLVSEVTNSPVSISVDWEHRPLISWSLLKSMVCIKPPSATPAFESRTASRFLNLPHRSNTGQWQSIGCRVDILFESKSMFWDLQYQIPWTLCPQTAGVGHTPHIKIADMQSVLFIPIGSMYGRLMLTFGVYWWWPCYHIWHTYGSYGIASYRSWSSPAGASGHGCVELAQQTLGNWKRDPGGRFLSQPWLSLDGWCSRLV